jgi:hypothetical protein
LAYGYAVLGTNAIPTTGTVTCTNDGPGGTINGNVGTTGASITNIGPCIISGSTDVSLPLSGAGAVTDFHSAYSAIDALNPDSQCLAMPTVSGPVSPGVYCSAASTTLGAGIILTLNGNASDVWVFKVGTIGSSGALTLTDFQMVMGPGAQACNVFWRTAADATMTRSIVMGTILSGGAITETGGSLLGRSLATTDVTLTDPSPLTFAGCAAPAPGSITIVKNTVGGNGTFNYTGAQSFSIITVLGTGSNATAFASVAPGTYNVTETVPVGWNLTGLTCSNASTVNVGTATANVAVAAGEAVTCTYTNTNNLPTPISVPTLSEWGMIILMVLVGLMSIYYLRRQKAKA